MAKSLEFTKSILLFKIFFKTTKNLFPTYRNIFKNVRLFLIVYLRDLGGFFSDFSNCCKWETIFLIISQQARK